VVDSSPPVKLGAAIVVLAQAKPRAQPWLAAPLWSSLAGVAGRCSGISQVSSVGRSENSAHAADPIMGCNWKRRSRTAKVDFIGLNAIGSHPPQQEASWYRLGLA
jgi:hypothetical protein